MSARMFTNLLGGIYLEYRPGSIAKRRRDLSRDSFFHTSVHLHGSCRLLIRPSKMSGEEQNDAGSREEGEEKGHGEGDDFEEILDLRAKVDRMNEEADSKRLRVRG